MNTSTSTVLFVHNDNAPAHIVKRFAIHFGIILCNESPTQLDSIQFGLVALADWNSAAIIDGDGRRFLLCSDCGERLIKMSEKANEFATVMRR